MEDAKAKNDRPLGKWWWKLTLTDKPRTLRRRGQLVYTRPDHRWAGSFAFVNCYVSARSTRLGVAGILHSSAGKWRTRDVMCRLTMMHDGAVLVMCF